MNERNNIYCFDVDSISRIVKMHIRPRSLSPLLPRSFPFSPLLSIETHFDDNIVGNWRSHRRHSIHTTTNTMKNINPDASNVKFIAYNVVVALSANTNDTTHFFVLIYHGNSLFSVKDSLPGIIHAKSH